METAARRRLQRRERTRLLFVAASLSRRHSISSSIVSSFKRGSIEVVTNSGFPPGGAGSVPDLIVADLDSSPTAETLIRYINEAAPGAGVVALIDDPDPRWMQAALQAGINAVVSREPSAEELHLALAAADAGLILLHPTSARGLVLAGPQSSEPTHDYERLTSREFEVLRLLSDGLGNKEIASRLAISEHTAKFHISSILGKLGVATRTEAVSHGIKKGLIPI